MNTRHEQILILKRFSEQEGRLIDDLLEAVAAALDLPDLAGPASGTFRFRAKREQLKFFCGLFLRILQSTR